MTKTPLPTPSTRRTRPGPLRALAPAAPASAAPVLAAPALIAVVLLLLLAGRAHASVVVEASVEEMTRLSTLVVRGTVLSVTARPVGETEGHQARPARVVTDVTLRVDELLKGEHAGETLSLTLPGGSAGKYAQRVTGVPTFRAGEEVVLFLERTKKGFTPSGLQQGKFTILREPISGLEVALRGFDPGLTLVRRDADGALVPAAPTGPATPEASGREALDQRPLASLRDEIRATVRLHGPLAEPLRAIRLPK